MIVFFGKENLASIRIISRNLCLWMGHISCHVLVNVDTYHKILSFYGKSLWLSTGIGFFNMGEGAAQDCLWSTLPAADVQGAQAGVWAVREGTGGGRTAREAQQAEREERTVQTTSWRSTSHQQVRDLFLLTAFCIHLAVIEIQHFGRTREKWTQLQNLPATYVQFVWI